MSARLAFLIPSKDRHACLARTLPRVLSAVRAAPPGSCQIVICDQSPTPFAAPAMVTVLHRPGLNGLPAARNLLLASCSAEVVCFLDDDTDLAGDFALRLLELALGEPAQAAWGPVVEARGRWTRRLHRLFQLGVFHDPRRQCAGPRDQGTSALFGCCFAVRRAPALRTGFDARLTGYALGEDLDFFLRLGALVGGARAIRFAAALRARHRRDGADRARRAERGRAKAAFLVRLARRHGGRNPATLLHLALALLAAASGRGEEPGAWRGVWRGVIAGPARSRP
jgi:hypothetical protein